MWHYLIIHVGLSISAIVIGTGKYALAYTASVRASRIMFDSVSYTILRAPLRWLDTVPVGRILNRFTADFNVLDSRVANDLALFLSMLLDLIAISIASFIVSPLMIIFAAASMIVALLVAMKYMDGAREVKRLESNANSPIIELFVSTLAGVSTIRAFDKVEEYIDR